MDAPTYPSRFPEQMALAYATSEQYLADNAQLNTDLSRVRRFIQFVLMDAVPSDFDSLRKIGYFPFAEASIEGSFALDLALAGMHKQAYACLRAYLEMSTVGLHFLALPVSDESGVRWVKGLDPTPFRGRVIRVLNASHEFAEAAAATQWFQRFDEVYGRLSDITHTRGLGHGHRSISRGNVPRFVDSSLVAFIADSVAATNIVVTAFSILHPVIVIPLPVEAKFGLNTPLSGFLEEPQVEVVLSFLDAADRNFLVDRAETDEYAQAAKTWIEGRPDLTEEQWETQFADFDDFFSAVAPPPRKHPQG